MPRWTSWVSWTLGSAITSRLWHDALAATPRAPWPAQPWSMTATRRELSLDEYHAGVLAGDRTVLGRAITLVESHLPEHQALAQDLLVALLPESGKAHRLGVTGVPGVGKSTLIESLGSWLTERGHRVAVLAIDPSSAISGGSILGDKTRMARLATNDRAFIRPSPSAGTLGGVARKTRETMIVCEAAGFDVVFVETVGVGQSETVAARLVDFFLVLILAGGGDELQGIKRGIVELADLVAINKADGDNVERAERARREYANALSYMRPVTPTWRPPVLTCSGAKPHGLDRLWGAIDEHRRLLTATGEFEARRRSQRVDWMWAMVEERLLSALRNHADVRSALPALEQQVISGATTPTLAAEQLLHLAGHT